MVRFDDPTYRYRWHEGSRTMNAGNSLSRRLTAENLAIAEKHIKSATDLSAQQDLKLWHHRQSTQAALCCLEALHPPRGNPSRPPRHSHQPLLAPLLRRPIPPQSRQLDRQRLQNPLATFQYKKR